jgi:hypothetical protein
MWTTENRGRYKRGGLRYPSDLTDGQWAQVEPLVPPAKRGGRRREVDVREVVNGLLYVVVGHFEICSRFLQGPRFFGGLLISQ